MNTEHMNFIMLPEEAWVGVTTALETIQSDLKELKTGKATALLPGYITAREFMNRVSIKRTKFDELRKHNKIKTVKKRRKIYVLAAEVERYFIDASIL